MEAFSHTQALAYHWQVAEGTSRGVRPIDADGGLAECCCRVAWRGCPAVSSRPRQQHTMRDVLVRRGMAVYSGCRRRSHVTGRLPEVPVVVYTVHVSDSRLTFDDAQTYCRRNDAHLVPAITSAHQQKRVEEAIRESAAQNVPCSVWIGVDVQFGAENTIRSCRSFCILPHRKASPLYTDLKFCCRRQLDTFGSGRRLEKTNKK